MTDAATGMTETADVVHPTGRRPRGLSAILVVLAGAVLFPVLATALNGFKDIGEFRTNPFGLPHVWMYIQTCGSPNGLVRNSPISLKPFSAVARTGKRTAPASTTRIAESPRGRRPVG